MSYSMDGTPIGGYQPAPRPQAASTQPQDHYPHLSQILHTEEGFRRSIRFTGGADAVLGVVLTVAVIALAYNVLSTFQSFSLNHLTVTPSHFWRLFTSTINTSGQFSPMLWAMIYVPLIAIPVVIILLIVKRVTLAGSIAKVYDRFMQGGCIMDLLPTGIQWQVSNSKGQFYVAGPSTLPSDWLPAAAQRIAGIVANDPKGKPTKEYLKGLAKAAGTVSTVAPASLGDPGLPPGIYLALLLAHDGRPRIAVPEQATGRFNLYALKKDVPIA